GGRNRSGTVRTDPAFGAVFDDFNSNGRKFKNLTLFAVLFVKFTGVRPEKSPAVGAAGVRPESVLDDAVRAVGLEQGLADMTVLPTGLASGLASQALRFGWRVEVTAVGGRRTAAVATIAL